MTYAEETKTAPIVLTVSQITKAIKLQLEAVFSSVVIRGEVSNLKVQSSGHVYFSLKDTESQISCVLFRMEALKLKAPLKLGDMITVKGEVSVYAARGNYQLIVRHVELQGLGDALQRLEQLKEKLKTLGYFDTERKRKLPLLPQVIGVVTSPTGAVICDIINVLTRRLGNFHLILNPVRVQGDGAGIEIAKAIDQFNTYQLADVLIVGRGGGSMEELSAFNDEIVAKAIFESTIPVISAVGHESDYTIADLVADVRAPTPSAAAELVSLEKEKLRTFIEREKKLLASAILKTVFQKKESFTKLQRHPLFLTPSSLLGIRMQRLDDYKEAVESTLKRCIIKMQERLEVMKKNISRSSPSKKLQQKNEQIEDLRRNLDRLLRNKLSQSQKELHLLTSTVTQTINNRIKGQKKLFLAKQFEREIQKRILSSIHTKRQLLDKLSSHFQSVDPKNLLKRGYSILFSEKNGSVITSINDLSKNDLVRLQLSDGNANAQIVDISKQTTQVT